MDATGGLAVSAFVRSGLFDVLKNSVENARYGVLATIRAKVHMNEARRDAIHGLEENLKSEVKVWSGLGWEADKCPAVGLAKGMITDQSDVEALAAFSISIYDQAILDIGSEELRGRKGFSHIAMSKLQESKVLVDSKDATCWLKTNALESIRRQMRRNQNLDLKQVSNYRTEVTYLPLKNLVTKEVAGAILQNAAERQLESNASVRIISKEEAEVKHDKQDSNDDNDKLEEEVQRREVVLLRELEFDSKMERMLQTTLRTRPSVLQTQNDNRGSVELPKVLIPALVKAAREHGIQLTNDGVGRIIQSELVLTTGRPIGPVRLCIVKETGAWEFNGLLSRSDVNILNAKSDSFVSTAGNPWTRFRSEEQCFSYLCAFAACLSSSLLITYEDRADMKKFSRRHLVLNESGEIQAVMTTQTSGHELYTLIYPWSKEALAQTEEDILNDFIASNGESSISYSMFRGWCAILGSTPGCSASAFSYIAIMLDKGRRCEFIAFLKGIASGKFSRFQREECSQELYLDVEEGKSTTGCGWLDDLIRGWAVSKTSTRIRVALTLKREEIGSALAVDICAKVPETDLELMIGKMRDIKKLVTRQIRRGNFLGERGNVVALANSYKDREFSARNRFRRYFNDKFVVHISGKNVIVVEKNEDSRRATWLPCEPEGIAARSTINRVGELSDKAALALLLFGRSLDLMDDVDFQDLTGKENGDSTLEIALTQIVTLATEQYDSAAELARSVIRTANEKVSLTRNDNDMIKRYIMVTAYAEGAGKVTTSGKWKVLVPEVKPARGDIRFCIDYKMPSIMLHGDGEWVVVQKRAYHTKELSGNERFVEVNNVKDAGYLAESLWPGGLVLA